MRKKAEINLEDILTDKVSERDLLEVPLSDRVFKTVFTAAALLVLVGLGYMLYFCVFKSAFYQRCALANMSGVIMEKAERGIIFDSSGKPLVSNQPILNAVLIPTVFSSEEKDSADLLGKIKGILSFGEDEWQEKLERINSGEEGRILLRRDLTLEETATLESLQTSALKIEKDFGRQYSDPSFSHILGYVGLTDRLPDDTIGKAGLEAEYDKWLRGRNGQRIEFRDALGRPQGEKLVRKSGAGFDLRLFIDKEFQDFFSEHLQSTLAYLGRTRGAGVAIDPRDGRVLALVSLPEFDAGKVESYLEEKDNPLFNRVISGQYNPGSIIKPVMAVAGLSQGVMDAGDSVFSAGYLDVPNPFDPDSPTRFLDWRPHGWVDLYSALARSSNIYFYAVGGGLPEESLNLAKGKIGRRGLGLSNLRTYWDRFGFGKKTGIDLPGEKQGFFPSEEKGIRLGDLYNLSIGQGDFLATPIQLLNFVSAIANRGTLFQPRILDVISDRSGETITKSEPVVIGDLSDLKEAINEARKGMEDCVRMPYGTASLLADLPFSVAAKTGTAQIEGNTKINAFFAGYAPAENPEIAILILVEDAREGSLNTLAVAKDILLWYYNNR